MRILTICFFLILSGCTYDISRDSSSYTDYVVGAVYRVKQPLILHEGSLYDSTRYTVQIEGAPVSPGTLIRVTRILLSRGSMGETTIWIKAEIVNGPLSNKQVELAYLSANRVDTNILEIVSAP